jgi:hypothetical protein
MKPGSWIMRLQGVDYCSFKGLKLQELFSCSCTRL